MQKAKKELTTKAKRDKLSYKFKKQDYYLGRGHKI